MSARAPLRLWLALAGASLVAGCATTSAYNDAKQYVEPGGKGDRDIAQAKDRLDRERAAQSSLQASAASNQAKLASLNQKIGESQRDLKAQEDRLAAAQRDRKISKADHDRLAQELSAVQRDLDRLKAASAQASSGGKASSVQEQEQRLAALQKRKAELEKAVTTILSGR